MKLANLDMFNNFNTDPALANFVVYNLLSLIFFTSLLVVKSPFLVGYLTKLLIIQLRILDHKMNFFISFIYFSIYVDLFIIYDIKYV